MSAYDHIDHALTTTIGLSAATALTVLITAGLFLVTTTIGLRVMRYAILAHRARVIEIQPPPTATMDQAHAFWAHAMGLLKPRWRRALLQPHLAFEVLASANGVRLQMWVPGIIPPGVVERAIAAHWPGATTHTTPATRYRDANERTHAIGGWLAMARPDDYPLRTTFADDPMRALLGAVRDLGPDQSVCVRVCARPATGWRLQHARISAARLRGRTMGIARMVWDPLGPSTARAPAWPDVTDNIRAILTKANSPRLACHASYLLATTSTTQEAHERLRGRAHSVASYAAAFGSGTQQLTRSRMWWPQLWRTHRYLARGYLLSVSELAALAHIPTDEVIPGLERAGARRIAPTPSIPTGDTNARVIGDADTGNTRPVALTVPDARQHTHIVGKTGSGKSTLLANLALQDAHAGRPALVIDPRGDLVTDILARLPKHAGERVVLWDPDDNAAPPRLNLLHGADPEFTSDTVVGVFRRLFASSWGPRSDDILRSASLTLTRANDPTLTLGDIPRLLADDAYRARLVGRIQDEFLAGFWHWYEDLSRNARTSSTGPVLNKLRTVLLRPWVRNVVASGPNSVSLPEVWDNGGLVLMRLPKGVLGEDTASLIGAFALALTWQTVTSRVGIPEHQRNDVNAYIDEAHNFLLLPRSMSDMLAEARGYHLGLTLAHQELSQLPPELRKALAANARSKIFFTSSPEDATSLQDHTLPELGAHDLSHLGAYQGAARLLVNGRERPAFTMRTRALPPRIPGRATAIRQAARQHSPPTRARAPRTADARTRLNT
ncbi:energy-coupling factor transporter ATP-binding protein EcfA2 [Lipingzhangella halophila]|uniref:Energy-coupling factor transporter ATP-binding protein EcfA2 n=1 Tax=Lipingzhangella halophila TaxID=1783352 RepID=A0A7W7RMY1_9ACTN|nr:DUF87 domain-containing protein [Lipingzhangella halophila]MBB4934421.1 energy-coupling factor transporter ATP-binding protein EcfA2 [Lipingzhangella halophila]